LVSPLSVLAATGAFAVVIHLRDPTVPGHYPTCPWLWLTGTYCPGCGSLRACHALTNADVVTAFHYNPFAVIVAVGLAATWLRWVRRQWRGAPRTWIAPPWMVYLLIASIMAFWVLRNVPGFEFLGPRP